MYKCYKGVYRRSNVDPNIVKWVTSGNYHCIVEHSLFLCVAFDLNILRDLLSLLFAALLDFMPVLLYFVCLSSGPPVSARQAMHRAQLRGARGQHRPAGARRRHGEHRLRFQDPVRQRAGRSVSREPFRKPKAMWRAR